MQSELRQLFEEMVKNGGVNDEIICLFEAVIDEIEEIQERLPKDENN